MPFDLSEEVRDEYTILFLQGVYNTQTIKHMKPRLYELAEEWGCKIIVDLNEALFIDVSCLGAFLKAHRTELRRGGNIVFVNRNDHIRNAFEAVQMDRILNIVPNLAEAHDFFAAKEEAI
ncbi:STAS domain-containing protein [Maridesulfovibrio frigidus]|uniref:STAS domain-containing protein n=1 Tax=Maridesulfovibrio frigidus TaxID=340956 RepID=UPI00146FA740|nr:STAS domain-containing protein [Maridesulfovibrio frigidus]